MLCRNPYRKGKMLFGCGQCLPCRINRRREWLHRMILEAKCHEHSAFLSLTYSDQNLPLSSNGLPTLNPKHLQDWLKRFRKEILPLKIRFFAVGEYGDETNRPHYHAIIYGYRSCEYINSRYSKFRTNCCRQCDLVRDTWQLGNVYLGTVDPESMQYCAGYTVKKLTKEDDPRLNGRHPEFARMSTRPGLGYDALHEVASTLMQFNLDERDDVPSSLQHGKKILPLGRYLRQNLRLMVGKEKNAPSSTVAKAQEKMQTVLDDLARTTSLERNSLLDAARIQMIYNADEKVRRIEAWQKIRKKRTSL